jgi:hypothetical protein
VAAATAAVLAWFALVVWMSLVRPAVHAHRDHLLVRNMLSDTEIPWHLIDDVSVRQTTRVYVADTVYHGIGMGRSTRSIMMDNLGRSPRRGGGSVGLGGRALPEPEQPRSGTRAALDQVRFPDFVEARLVELANERADASRARPTVRTRWARVEATAFVVLTVVAAALVVLASVS